MYIEDIPKLYTALAEWLSCMVFVLALERRKGALPTAGIMLIYLPVFFVLQHYIGVWPVNFWIPAMVAAMGLMFSCVLLSCRITVTEAGLCFAVIFMLAEFIASFEWQIYSFVTAMGYTSPVVEVLFLLVFYGGLYVCAYLLVRRYFGGEGRREVTAKETISAIVMSLAVFLISNISYVYPHTPFSSTISDGLFYIRTLVDFSGVLILFLQLDRMKEAQLKKERDAANTILRRQYEQYNLSKENIELINRKYHDLKHQIAVIRSETSPEKREQYLQQMESEIRMYEAQNKTGNAVLDVIISGKHMHCVQQNINFTCVADGELLDFMDTMDICTIFGNALDNAIESVEQNQDSQKRIIRVAVYAENHFLIIRFENYCSQSLIMEHQLPATTKKNRDYHGYGLKSIQSTVEKYGGSMTVRQEDDWFYLRLLIPLKNIS